MDWIELLLVAVFFGAPLLGRLFQQKPPAPPPALPRGDAPPPPDLQARLPAPARATLPAPAGAGADAGGGWSAGWGEWPEGASEEEDAAEEAGGPEEGVVGDHDLAADSIHTREAISLEPVTAPEGLVRPLPDAPVGLDTVAVDWNREHVRFHDRYFKAAPPPLRADRLADHLRSRAEVRRAILLAEVLGPPRSLRELDSER